MKKNILVLFFPTNGNVHEFVRKETSELARTYSRIILSDTLYVVNTNNTMEPHLLLQVLYEFMFRRGKLYNYGVLGDVYIIETDILGNTIDINTGIFENVQNILMEGKIPKTISSNVTSVMRDYINDLIYVVENPRVFLYEYFQQMRWELDVDYETSNANNICTEDSKEMYISAIDEIYKFENSLSLLKYDFKDTIVKLKSKELNNVEEISTYIYSKIFNNRSIFLHKFQLIIIEDVYVDYSFLKNNTTNITKHHNKYFIKYMILRRMLYKSKFCMHHTHSNDMIIDESIQYKIQRFHFNRVDTMHIDCEDYKYLSSSLFEEINDVQELKMNISCLPLLESNVLDKLNCKKLEIHCPSFNKKIETLSLLKLPNNLMSFKITCFKFETLPDYIITNSNVLQSLTILDLSNNSIENINYFAFDSLDSLQVLNLANNEILTFNKVIIPASLVELNISSNHFRDVHSINIKDLCNLKILNLSKNWISCVKNVVFPNSLEELYLNSNSLSEIHEIKVNNLKILKLSDNCIKNIKGVVFPKSLVVLNLDNNELIYLGCCLSFNPNLTTLSLNSNKIHTILENAFSGLNIKDLTLSIFYNPLDIRSRVILDCHFYPKVYLI